MKNQLKTVALLGVLSALLVGIGGMIGTGYLYLFGALALVMNIGAYFFSDKIVLRMHRAEEISPSASPRLFHMVKELADRAQIPMPRVYLIRSQQPNAFATGRNPEHGVIALTEGIIGLLSERELRGVVAHELAHIKNRDILIQSIAAVVTTAITYVAQALSFSALFGGRDDRQGSPIGAILVAIVAPIAAGLVQMGISRSREYLADEGGARICGDPEALASALLKLDQGSRLRAMHAAPATASMFIVNPFSAQARGRSSAGSMQSWFSTHPPISDRVARLRALCV